jgi:chaperonin cofactor prefoldin
MSTLKTVGNKLFKTELASHNVELANLKDLQAASAKVTKDLAAGQKYQDQLDKLKSEASALGKKFNEFSSNAKSGMPLSANLWTMIKEIEGAAKELGLDASNTPIVQDARNTMNAWEEWKTDVAKMATESAEYAKRF